MTIDIRDEVSNLSGNAGEMQLLYHINLGPPLHTPGAELLLPVKEMAPRDENAVDDVSRWNTYGPPTAAAEGTSPLLQSASRPRRPHPSRFERGRWRGWFQCLLQRKPITLLLPMEKHTA